MLQRFGLLLVCMAVACADAPPEFPAAGLVRGERRIKMVVPGTILTIYGQNLAPSLGECRESHPATSYPTEYCGTQVLLDDTPAKLLYVGDKQINFKVPLDLAVPQSGMIHIRVESNGQSSLPLAMQAGFERTTVSLDGPAYTGMPIWLNIDLPFERTGAARYPFLFGPADFGCNVVQIRRNGQVLPRQPVSNWIRHGVVMTGGPECPSYSPAGGTASDRLPLHLQYRLDVPGIYEVRYSFNHEESTRSEWTPIEVLAATPRQRSEWLKTLRERPPIDPFELLTNTLPSLLGMPDDASFAILAGYLYHPDSAVRRYALDGLSYWPREYVIPRITALSQIRGSNDVVTKLLKEQATGH